MSKIVEFVGVGVQKAGTTFIHRILDEHPQLCVAHGKDKDTMFFGAKYDRGYEWYERNFESCDPDKIIGEVSTSYFYHSDVPQRIKKYNKNVKIFVCLRNPVDRIISNHKHEARLGHISGNNLDLSVALKNNPAYLMQSHYSKHIKKWYEHFNKDQMHIILFDDLVNRPQFLAHQLYEFLGVDSGFVPGFGKQDNSSRVPANRKIERSIKAAGGIIRTAGLGKVVDIGRRYGFNDWLRAKNTVSDEGAVLSIKTETLVELKEQLRPDIVELSALTGLDLSAWLAD